MNSRVAKVHHLFRRTKSFPANGWPVKRKPCPTCASLLTSARDSDRKHEPGEISWTPRSLAHGVSAPGSRKDFLAGPGTRQAGGWRFDFTQRRPRWFGLNWSEGPEQNGPFGPYSQIERTGLHRATLDRLREGGFLFPCTCSRKDILSAVAAPHDGDNEPIYAGTCRLRIEKDMAGKKFGWRFRVPDGEVIAFEDKNMGSQRFVAGKDFGDFVVWRPDDVPAYQLACVVDDFSMKITEVVRGADLLASTARQLLIYRAMGWSPPAFFHCELMRDEKGRRLAKRHDSLSLRQLRAQNVVPEVLRKDW